MRSTKDLSRFLLRIPEATHQKLVKLARTQSCSINQLCNELIESGLRRHHEPNAKLLQHIQTVYADHGLIAIVLFGSQARGDSTESSDTDLLLVFKPGTAITRQLHQQLERSHTSKVTKNENIDLDSISIHCVALPTTEPNISGFWLEIALDGVILWGAENISNYINKVKQKISSGQLIRKVTHGQPYWIHQNEK
jgi:predicted nucleotidyltransferase